MFAGFHVAILTRASVVPRREVRIVVERLGGTCAFSLTPRATVVVTDGDPPAGGWPAHVREVWSEAEFHQRAGLPDPETLRTQFYSAKDLQGMYPGLREDHLRYLAKWGLIRPVVGRYSFNDLHVIKAAAADLSRGVPLHAILRDLTATRAGQLSLDFQPTRTDTPRARVVSLPAVRQLAKPAADRAAEIRQANYALAAKYFLDAAQLDDGEDRDLEQASAAYRRALMFDPELVPALVNLANIHYEQDQLVEAEALYEKAIRIDAECFEAYFNLGNIHHDLARYAEAVVAYREALGINPSYPEAHFYLAVTLEKLGRSAEARNHWQHYRDLEPEGEFVELAREFSD